MTKKEKRIIVQPEKKRFRYFVLLLVLQLSRGMEVSLENKGCGKKDVKVVEKNQNFQYPVLMLDVITNRAMQPCRHLLQSERKKHRDIANHIPLPQLSSALNRHMENTNGKNSKWTNHSFQIFLPFEVNFLV